jgi:hypothetical protein
MRDLDAQPALIVSVLHVSPASMNFGS